MSVEDCFACGNTVNKHPEYCDDCMFSYVPDAAWEIVMQSTSEHPAAADNKTEDKE